LAKVSSDKIYSSQYSNTPTWWEIPALGYPSKVTATTLVVRFPTMKTMKSNSTRENSKHRKIFYSFLETKKKKKY